MPTYMDHHAQFPKPDAAGLAALRGQVTGPANEHGVKGIDVLFAEDGSGMCLMEGPSREAVLRSHDGTGLALELADIREFTAVM